MTDDSTSADSVLDEASHWLAALVCVELGEGERAFFSLLPRFKEWLRADPQNEAVFGEAWDCWNALKDPLRRLRTAQPGEGDATPQGSGGDS